METLTLGTLWILYILLQVYMESLLEVVAAVVVIGLAVIVGCVVCEKVRSKHGQET